MATVKEEEEGALLFITNSPAPPRLCRATGAAAAAAVGVLDAYRASSHFQQSSSSKQLPSARACKVVY